MSEKLKKELIMINKNFSDGTIRYEGELDGICSTYPSAIEVAKKVAERHPFMDGNKRTAIRFMELMMGKEVPEFVYEILERS